MGVSKANQAKSAMLKAGVIAAITEAGIGIEPIYAALQAIYESVII